MKHSPKKHQSSNSELEQIFPLLLDSSGIDFNLYKIPTLKRAIAKRMLALKIRNIAKYLDYLKKDKWEAKKLSQDMLIKVTEFFRDSEVFRLLKKKVFPEIVSHKGQNSIRIWVPGCCTGEEVYSLAITLSDFFQEKNLSGSIQIFGTDVNEEALNKARSGIYSKRDIKTLSPGQLSRYFKPLNGMYQIDKELRRMCTFSRQDLIQDPPFSHLDLVSCRNVLIYLKPEVQEKIVKIFHYAMNDHGFLVLGKSENISMHPALFSLMNKGNSLYTKKKMAATPGLTFRFTSSAPKKAPLDLRAVNPTVYEFNIAREVDRVLIERTGHAAILINEANEVIHTRGDISPYFHVPSGKMTVNVFKMVNDDLAIELKTMVEKAQRRPEIILKTIEIGGHDILLEIMPLHKSLLKERYFLILLQPQNNTPLQEKNPRKDSQDKTKKVIRLKQELALTKAWMQSMLEEHETTIQDLKSAHEEVLSSNEELQSLNEELQTATEELESTNEELTTVNEQLQNHIDALRQSEERFRILVESVKEYAIFMLDPQGNVVTWNLGAERIKGYKAQEIIGSHFSKFYPPQDKAKPEKALGIAARTGIYKDEGWRLRKDGSKFWARVVITALKDKTGKLRGFVKVTLDMTEQRKAEEELRLSEERFRLMTETIQDYAIFMLDPKGHIVTWNLGAQRLKGYESKEIIGRHFSKFYPGKDILAKKPQKELKIALAQGRMVDEGWRVRKDGSRFWANATITALKDKEGRLRGFAKVTCDMSQRKRAEELLRQSEEYARSVIQTSNDAYISSDSQSIIKEWNRQAEVIFGWKRQEVIGRSLKETIIPPRFREAHEKGMRRFMSTGEGPVLNKTIELVALHRDGHEFPVEVTLWPIKLGDQVSFHAFMRDITERKKVEAALRNSNDELEARVIERTRELKLYAEELMRSNADLQQFAYIASHDLQEPLRMVSVYVDLLERSLKESSLPKVQEYFGFLKEGSVRAQRLISELLEYSRIGTKNDALEIYPIENIIKHVLSLMEVTIKESNATITYDNSLPAVPIDRFQMEQLFQNLISNAIKYRSKEPLEVHISAKHKGKEWIFGVKDNGIGIDPKYKNMIFVIFKRLHSAQDYPGTGIGLALCKKIVERHGGKIWVESRVGAGATFFFTLPERIKKDENPNH